MENWSKHKARKAVVKGNFSCFQRISAMYSFIYILLTTLKCTGYSIRKYPSLIFDEFGAIFRIISIVVPVNQSHS